MSAAATPSPKAVFHFALPHGKAYELKAFGRSYRLEEHTGATLADSETLTAARQPTHYAQVTTPAADVIQLMRIYGPADADGIRSLESMAVYTPQSPKVFTAADLAKA